MMPWSHSMSGWGNGVLALDILDHLREDYPESLHLLLPRSASLPGSPSAKSHLLKLLTCTRTFHTGYGTQPLRVLVPPRSCTLLPLHPRHNFPCHGLLSDFSSLPNTVTGANILVARTRYRDAAGPFQTLFVHSACMAPTLLSVRVMQTVPRSLSVSLVYSRIHGARRQPPDPGMSALLQLSWLSRIAEGLVPMIPPGAWTPHSARLSFPRDSELFGQYVVVLEVLYGYIDSTAPPLSPMAARRSERRSIAQYERTS